MAQTLQRKQGPFLRQNSETGAPETNGSSNSLSDSSSRERDRSLSLSGVGVQELKRYKVIKQTKEPTSPLRRFSKAKEDISYAFDLVKKCLLESQDFLAHVHKGAECQPLTILIKRAEGIKDILNRDHMKVAFFGRTSNGKSTVINALLRERVLPAGIGHTTNCFCSVVGVDESEGYLIPPNSQERQNVKNVRQLAHSLHKEHLDPNSLVQVFWPKNKCPLLSGEVELVDSPGFDMNPDLNEWINKYCLDADVFVLVSNAESTLMVTEKKFFHGVSERLSKPNIFILNNRWDCSVQDELDMTDSEEVKEQHLRANVDFLSQELAVVDESTAKERVFFVSAKEVLHVRTQTQPGTVEEEEGHGLARGWKNRLMAFEKFEELFKHCISNTAIHTKFEQHYKQGLEVVKELEDLLGQEVKGLAANIVTVKTKLDEAQEHHRVLDRDGQLVHRQCQEKALQVTDESVHKLDVVIRGTGCRLSEIVKRFGEEFSKESMQIYQQKLCDFMDKELSCMLEQERASYLDRAHEEIKGHILLSYSALKLSQSDSKHVYQQINPPPVNFALRCSDLCEDFVPDPHFNFFRSFNLDMTRLKSSVNLESVLGGMYSRLSQLWSLVPTEYAVPIVLLGGAMLLPRVFHWKPIVVSVGIYASLYTYKWSTHDEKTAIQNQFMHHVSSKLRSQSKATCQSYRGRMESGLDLLLQGLNGELRREVESVNTSINECTKERNRLESFQVQARSLKNNVWLLRNDFDKFKQNHLPEVG